MVYTLYMNQSTDTVKKSGMYILLIIILAIIFCSFIWQMRKYSTIAARSEMNSLQYEEVGNLPPKISEELGGTATSTGDMTELSIYFNTEDYSVDCGETVLKYRKVPRTAAVADASIKVLLEEQFPQLKDTYKGMVVRDGHAVLDFTKDALPLLNGAACQQASVKMPIFKTLTQYPGIKEVDYSIDGVIKTDWDA